MTRFFSAPALQLLLLSSVALDLAFFCQAVMKAAEEELYGFLPLFVYQLLEDAVLGFGKVIAQRRLLALNHLQHYHLLSGINGLADFALLHGEGHADAASHGPQFSHLRATADQIAGLDRGAHLFSH